MSEPYIIQLCEDETIRLFKEVSLLFDTVVDPMIYADLPELVE